MIQVVFAEHLQFLDSNAGKQGDRGDPLRSELLQMKHNPTPHAKTHGMNFFDSQAVEEVDEVSGMGLDGVVGERATGQSKTWQVHRKNPVISIEQRAEAMEIAGAPRAAVYQ
jgi:hypothetical protein